MILETKKKDRKAMTQITVDVQGKQESDRILNSRGETADFDLGCIGGEPSFERIDRNAHVDKKGLKSPLLNVRL